MDAYIKVSKRLIQKVGLTAALLHGDLLSKQQYFTKQGKLGADGYFFNSHENIETDTGISRRQQYRVVKELEDASLLFVKRIKGVPNFYKVVEPDSTCDETAHVPVTERHNQLVTERHRLPVTKRLANNNNVNKNNELASLVLNNEKNQDAVSVKTKPASELSASRRYRYKLDFLLADYNWLATCLQEERNPFLDDNIKNAGDAQDLYNQLVACVDNDKTQVCYTGGSITVTWIQDMYRHRQEKLTTQQ